MRQITKHFIGGELVESHGKEKFQLINPSNQEIIGEVTLGDVVDTQRAIKAAQDAFVSYSKSTREERADVLQKFHDAVTARSEDHVKALIEEYGGTLANAQGFVYASGLYILSIKESLKQVKFKEDANGTEIVQVPVGVAGIITPWNASLLYICNKTAAALAAGCTVVIKPSEMSGLQTQVLMECLAKSNIPKGLINIVNGKGDVVGNELTTNPGIAKISFTGSTAVGKSIAKNAAETMKRVTLELGGKSPHIVMEDADFSKAVPFVLQAGFMNNGQACISGTRILVPESRIREFNKALKSAVEKVNVGAPGRADTVLGPLVSKTQYARVQGYINKGIAEGAEVLTGGPGHPEGLEQGNFVKPTVFVNVKNHMTIAREEIFGPVLSVISYKNIDDAIAIANDTPYGLAAYVSGSDSTKAKQIAELIEAGAVSVNQFNGDPSTPFGGVKQSGLGRENGIYGIESFLEYKTIAGK